MHDYMTTLWPSAQYYVDPRNTFALRVDFYAPQFELGTFVIVPKGGQFLVHFLRECGEYPGCYHNVAFDYRELVSQSFLYARFAWTIILLSTKFSAHSVT